MLIRVDVKLPSLSLQRSVVIAPLLETFSCSLLLKDEEIIDDLGRRGYKEGGALPERI